MIFYHGSNTLIEKIDLGRSRNRVDFGKGFYLTDKLGTAYSWAVRKAELEGDGIPTVTAYEVSDDIFALFGLRFMPVPERNWLEFICTNRSMVLQNTGGKEPRHDYHWVSGPIADDKVVDVVAAYMREEVSAEEAISRLRAMPQTYQVSLHTSAALGFVDDVNAQYKQLKKGRWTQNWIKSK